MPNLSSHKNFSFSSELKCYPLSFIGRKDFEKGDKIILPPSILENLSTVEIKWPIMFEVFNKNSNRKTHCGVLEFIADEGCVYLPIWMMKNISASEGEKIFLKYKYLEKGSYVKIQPQTNDFFEISNTKAILESKLRNFTCLTKTDLIAIEYNEKIYWLNIIEVKPGNAISIVETDINLDFISPSLYNERNQNSLKNKSNLIINEKKKKEKNSTTMDFDKFSSESI